MSHRSQPPAPTRTRPDRLVRVAGLCAYASGIACIFGIGFLVAFLTTFIGLMGTLNDVSVIVQYTLALPVVLALQRLLQPRGPTLSLVALVLGLVGMAGVIVLQALLVVGVLSFGRQIGMVVAAFMAILAWLVITGHLGRTTKTSPKDMFLHVLAGLYFGYPVWAFSLARRLREHGLS